MCEKIGTPRKRLILYHAAIEKSILQHVCIVVACLSLNINLVGAMTSYNGRSLTELYELTLF